MTIVGGAISGYCDSGKSGNENAPIKVMTIAITAAKIGRSMKKREKFIVYFCAGATISADEARGVRGAGADAPVAPAVCLIAPFWGWTFWPGRARCTPLMITWSFAV